MRLFVALNLPEAEKARLHRITAPLRSAGLPVRWTAADSYHLTLKFLGEVHESAVDEIAGIIARVAEGVPPLRLELHDFGGFPNLRRPRVIWVGIESAPDLLRLQDELESGLAPLGFKREDRPFHPHLTLGRAQVEPRVSQFGALETLARAIPYHATVDVDSVDLMRSHPGRGGARYERIRQAMLGTALRTT